MKPTFSVSWEINYLDADNPLDAAKQASGFIKDSDDAGQQFYVKNEQTGEIFSVDLMEDDEDAVLPVTPENYKSVIK